MKVYNKLVRDKIPQVIEEDGRKCETSIVLKEQLLPLLEDKLKEEINEFIQDRNLEELADIMEVVFGLAENLGYSEEDLLKKREEKKEARGGFKEGVFLKTVE